MSYPHPPPYCQLRTRKRSYTRPECLSSCDYEIGLDANGTPYLSGTDLSDPDPIGIPKPDDRAPPDPEE